MGWGRTGGGVSGWGKDRRRGSWMGEGPEEGLVGGGRTGGGVSGWEKDRRRG